MQLVTGLIHGVLHHEKLCELVALRVLKGCGARCSCDIVPHGTENLGINFHGCGLKTYNGHANGLSISAEIQPVG
jgi:hypothetical protein